MKVVRSNLLDDAGEASWLIIAEDVVTGSSKEKDPLMGRMMKWELVWEVACYISEIVLNHCY